MSYLDQIADQLRADEGVREKPYRDTVGKLTIGCGRNLDDIGLSQDEISFLLDNDIKRAEATARTLFPTFDQLSDNRKVVLVSMAFNVGQQGLAGFAKLRAAVAAGDFSQAAVEMMNSRWSTQVGRRADRLAKMMRDG